MSDDYDKLEDFKKGIKYTFKVLEKQEIYYGGEHIEIAKSLSKIGAAFGKIGKKIESLEYRFKSLKMFESLWRKNNV